jgi:alkanesulfonate monooxygenase SsuD/methylene tetrahydromethanopterin reductase-like flavin-dependent oxidoreductase (luciferase family)
MISIGKIGIWFAHSAMSIAESVAFAQKVEACGYGALWIPEAVGREPFVHLAALASQTSTLVLATGIANIWARDAVTMAAAQKTLVEISGQRFLLGLGVSHAPGGGTRPSLSPTPHLHAELSGENGCGHL